MIKTSDKNKLFDEFKSKLDNSKNENETFQTLLEFLDTINITNPKENSWLYLTDELKELLIDHEEHLTRIRRLPSEKL